jgi:hypothetical protein
MVLSVIKGMTKRIVVFITEKKGVNELIPTAVAYDMMKNIPAMRRYTVRIPYPSTEEK